MEWFSILSSLVVIDHLQNLQHAVKMSGKKQDDTRVCMQAEIFKE
jgi:hypothetical protein